MEYLSADSTEERPVVQIESSSPTPWCAGTSLSGNSECATDLS